MKQLLRLLGRLFQVYLQDLHVVLSDSLTLRKVIMLLYQPLCGLGFNLVWILRLKNTNHCYQLPAELLLWEEATNYRKIQR